MWSLLSVVAEEERRDLRCYLQRALEVWSKQGKLTQPLVRTVCSHTANKQHEKVSRAFLGGYLELYMYMYLPSPYIIYNMYMYVLCMYTHITCTYMYMALYTIVLLGGFLQQYHVYRMYTNPCTQVMVCRID